MKMRWPGQRALETRIAELELRSYSDALTSALLGDASGDTTIKATSTAALEACAGFVGRAFACSEVKAGERVQAALSPACLAHLGRSLLQYGEMVLFIRVDRGRITLLPAQSWDIQGDPDPSTWRYRVTLGGASSIQTYEDVPADGVVHVQYAFDAREPWRGYGPLQVARLAGRLSSETVAALADESSGPRGSFLPTPVDGADPTVVNLRADARGAKGKMLFVEGGDWDAAGGGKYAGWQQARFGPSPPDGMVELLKVATAEVYAACGFNPGLFTAEGESGAREAYRQALHSVIAPLGRIVAAELSLKLDEAITLDWMELRAGDIAGRARAFQSMVGGGMDVSKAAALSGLVIDD